MKRLLLLLIAFPALAQQSPPSIESLLAAPFPSELTAAPTGNRVAWVQNARGVRNVLLAQAPDFTPRPLTAFTDDDGQELSQLTWTPDGQTLFFVRGGAPNRAGDIPNPTSHPAGAERVLWRVALNGPAAQRLTLGSAPAVSPRGDSLVFLNKGQVYARAVSGEGIERPLFQVRGGAAALRWSPDGTRLAFVSNRGDHAFVGVYDLTARSVRFMQPSVDTDAEPVWSPDGKRLAFLRIPAHEAVVFTPQREAQPWSLWVADAATGRGRLVWQADAGSGSAFREIVAENQLVWTADDRLIFPWEKDGYTHLYAVPVGGGPATLLTPGVATPGPFEVENLIVSADRKTMIFNSNQGDINRRHLWRLTTGGKPELLTPGVNIEWNPALLVDGSVAFLRSGARRPAQPAVLVGKSVRDIGPVPAGFGALVEPEAVTFTASDGMPIPAQLFLPKNAAKGQRHPAVIFFHGGSRRQMLLGFHYGNYYHHAYSFNQWLASQGYVVLSVNYRSGIGYGLNFREALHYGADGCSEFADVLGAGLYLKGRPDVRPDAIGLWGGSYGGYLTAMGLARASDLFAAGVDIHGVHDENQSIQNFQPGYHPLEHPDVARTAALSSPMTYLDGWRSPVLVIHGDDDRNVNFYQTIQLVRELRKRGVETEQLVFPDEVHSFLTHQHWLDAYRAASDFLGRTLRKDEVGKGK
jgi:dipeptidyl aminopeptidase/acylaminoacyl peptidase